jgi:hypothetical protein
MVKKSKGVGLRPAPKQIAAVELTISFIFQRNVNICVCEHVLVHLENNRVYKKCTLHSVITL